MEDDEPELFCPAKGSYCDREFCEEGLCEREVFSRSHDRDYVEKPVAGEEARPWDWKGTR